MNSLKCPNCIYTFEEKDIYGGKCHCPKCGGCFEFGNEMSDEINEGYRKLGKLEFKNANDIAEKLLAKDSANAEAWFLKVLAANRVCYCDNDNKTLWRYGKIPTLNDVGFSDIKKSDYAVNALKYAVTEEQTTRFNEVFDYLEKVRAKSAEVINSHKYDYDVFISVKVSAINPDTKQPITDASGNVLTTKDYDYANDLYGKIKDKYPDCKIFLSERVKSEFAGKEYEPIIFAALRSSKVMILVGDSNFNIEWPWVKNEWNRYLYWKDNLDDGRERNFVFVMRSTKVVRPQEFDAIQSIETNDLNATETLFRYLDKILEKKLIGKTFGGSVPETIGSAVASEIGKKTLNRYASSRNTAIESRIDTAIRDLEDTLDEDDPAIRGRKRKDCFDEFRSICKSDRNAHRAQLYLLLEKSNSVDFTGFFFDSTASAEAKKKFFDIADEKEAIVVIKNIVGRLTNETDDINESWNAFEAIAPYFDNIDKGDLENLSESMSRRTSKELSEMRKKLFLEDDKTRSVLKYAHCYLLLKQFLTDNDPKLYIEYRKKLLGEFGAIAASPVLIEEIGNICDEIEKVQPNNAYAIWYRTESRLFKTIESPQSLFDKYNSKDDYDRLTSFDNIITKERGIVVHNKPIIEAFDKLLFSSDAPEQSFDMFDKKTFLLFFLELIIRDDFSYEKTPEGAMVPSRGERDEDLNGYDLFSKYIEYDLGDNKLLWNADFDEEFDECDVLDPSYGVSALKIKRNPVDVMLSYFAVSLQVDGLFDEAISMYNLYLGQQSEQDREDCILIKFYMILCKNKCEGIDEQRLSPSRVDVQELKVEIDKLLTYYGKDNAVSKNLKDLRKTLTDFAARQNEFADYVREIGDLIESLPACNSTNYEVYSSTSAKIHDIIDKKSVGSVFDENTAERLKDFYKDKIAKLDREVATLKKIVQLSDKIFKGDYNKKTAWARKLRSDDYSLEDFEKDLGCLKENERFFDPATNLSGTLDFLLKKIEDKRTDDKRAYEESIKKERAKERAAKRGKVFGEIILVLLMIMSKLLVGFFVYSTVRIFLSLDGHGTVSVLNVFYFIFLGCAIFDFVSILCLQNLEGLHKFQCVISMIYVPVAIASILVLLLMGCNFSCSCGSEWGKEFLQFLAIAVPSALVSGLAIFSVND